MGMSNYLPSSRLIQSGVCTSTTRPASPYEGQAIYETDTNQIMIWNGSGWKQVPTDDTSATANFGTYKNHTVTWSGVTAGNGTLVARYTQINKFVHYWGRFTLGSTSSVSGQIGIDLPVNANSNYAYTDMGSAEFEYVGVATYLATPLLISEDLVNIYAQGVGSTYNTLASTSSTAPMTWASGHRIAWNITYEAA
jgi:hypothetical protein